MNILILDNIRSTHNVGSIFRTSDAIGKIDKIFLCGITPTPIDRFGRKRKDIAKSSLGAEDSIEWEYKKDISDLIKDLRKENYSVVSLEQDKERGVDYKNLHINSKNNYAIVLGREVEGISKEILDLSDFVLEIPMNGEKESLNVSVATGILLYELFNK